ncbi:MAG: peptidylprolyl isomerase [Williamsia herbipolensis]|nr:peptidylprolyl isomerase [Williamsia herbipolensis]
MPTNQQRREAAKRKLQRQLVRREEARARRRRTTLIVGGVAVVLIAAGVVLAITASNKESDAAGTSDPTASGSSSDLGTPTTSEGPAVPCVYTAGGTAAKPVELPSNTSPEQTGTVDVTMSLNGESVAISLDRSKAACSVNSFLSLASQGFYNDTSCHRLTASGRLNVLQCGDPSGKGNGGPGYGYAPTPPTGDKPYPVGTIAMANATSASGGSEEGSQFFIAYGTTEIPTSYSVIGTVSSAGMKVVDAVTSKGVKDDRQDGAPNAEAKIESITVPEAAVTASTSWSTPSESSADPSAEDTAIPSDGGSQEQSTSSADSTSTTSTSGAPSTTSTSSDGADSGSSSAPSTN